MPVPDTTTPWHPITDPVALKTLGKLSEEIAETIQELIRFESIAVGRFAYPTIGHCRKYLAEEFGDVLANSELVIEQFDLNRFENQTVKDFERGVTDRATHLMMYLATLSRIVARVIIQGLDGIDPKSEICNKDVLESTLSAVREVIQNAGVPFGLDAQLIQERKQKKLAYLRPLHAKA